MLRAREYSRNDLYENEKQQMSEKKLTANITDENVTSIMEDLHILLTPNKEHKTVIPNVHVVGLRNGRTLMITWSEQNYPNLRRVVDMNYAGK